MTRPAGGDLFNALHRGHKGNLTWHRRSANAADPLPAQPVQGLGKRIALDIARGLHFLHTHRIVSVALLSRPSNATSEHVMKHTHWKRWATCVSLYRRSFMS